MSDRLRLRPRPHDSRPRHRRRHLLEAAQECTRLGGRALAAPIDVTRPDKTETFLRCGDCCLADHPGGSGASPPARRRPPPLMVSGPVRPGQPAAGRMRIPIWLLDAVAVIPRPEPKEAMAGLVSEPTQRHPAHPTMPSSSDETVR